MFNNTMFRFLVPVTDNAGNAFTEADWQWLENQLFAIAGGCSMEGNVKGQWKGADGTVYHDLSRRYAVAVPPEREADLMARFTIIRHHFQQEALIVERAPASVAFV